MGFSRNTNLGCHTCKRRFVGRGHKRGGSWDEAKEAGIGVLNPASDVGAAVEIVHRVDEMPMLPVEEFRNLVGDRIEGLRPFDSEMSACCINRWPPIVEQRFV